MNLNKIEEYIITLFETTDNEMFYKESGINFDSKKEIKRIGYSTNLTLEVIEKAKEDGVDLIITHHDAWDFMYGLKDACLKKLEDYGISHYFNHLPLDDCSFGTNDSLTERLGLNTIERTHLEDGFYCGRVGEFKEEVSFKELVQRLEKILGEPVKAWKFNDRSIKRVGIVCGGGGLTPHVNEALEKNCDVYITGEKLLYTIQFAKFKKLNLIIGSHTFTELFGVENLVNKIKDKYSKLEIIKIEEERIYK